MATVQPSPLNPLGRSEEEQESPAIKEAKQVLQMLDPLLASPQFQELWKKLGERVLTQRKITLDPGTKKKQRDTAAKIHHALNEWYEYPVRQHAAAVARIQASDTRETQRTQADPVP